MKAKINLVIDALLLLAAAAIVGIGLMVRYVLPPGYQRWEVYGRNVELYFWGLDRHGWGSIHYVVGLAFLGLLVLHVVLHWGMVVAIGRRLIPNRLARRVAAVLLVALTVALVIFPVFVKPDLVEEGRGMHRGHRQRAPAGRMRRAAP
jgi:RsiW-degrading membrane proteinase PrsW (M82 family)